MLEDIGLVGRASLAVDQFRSDHMLDQAVELGLRDFDQRCEQRVIELAADDGADLDDLPGRSWPVEAGEQRRLGWAGRGRNGLSTASGRRAGTRGDRRMTGRAQRL